MLEKVPHAIGEALSGVRPGLDALVWADERLAAVPDTVSLTSTAFEDGTPLPARFSADGEGISPPLAWFGVPPEAEELVLLVEDADPPLPRPMVHAIVHRIPPEDGEFAEGELAGDRATPALGMNSGLHTAWMPPDPPTGHGPHRYVFQLYALDTAVDLGEAPGRSALRAVLAEHAIARGRLTGIYERP